MDEPVEVALEVGVVLAECRQLLADGHEAVEDLLEAQEGLLVALELHEHAPAIHAGDQQQAGVLGHQDLGVQGVQGVGEARVVGLRPRHLVEGARVVGALARDLVVVSGGRAEGGLLHGEPAEGHAGKLAYLAVALVALGGGHLDHVAEGAAGLVVLAHDGPGRAEVVAGAQVLGGIPSYPAEGVGGLLMLAPDEEAFAGGVLKPGSGVGERGGVPEQTVDAVVAPEVDGGLDQEGQGLLEDLGGRPRLLQALEGAAGPLLVAELVKGLAEQEQRLRQVLGPGEARVVHEIEERDGGPVRAARVGEGLGVEPAAEQVYVAHAQRFGSEPPAQLLDLAAQDLRLAAELGLVEALCGGGRRVEERQHRDHRRQREALESDEVHGLTPA